MSLKIKTKGSNDWKDHRACALGISLQSRNHTGEALDTIISWINDQHFEVCLIDLSDELQAHNLTHGEAISLEEARVKARKMGDEWLGENQEILDRIDIPYDLVRWNHWLEQGQFKNNLAMFRSAFNTEDKFRAAIKNDIIKFYTRHDLIPTEQQLRNGINYLLEELSVHSLMFENFECAFLYPGREQKVYNLMRTGNVSGVPTGIANSSFTRLCLYGFESEQEKQDKKAA